uniref:Uncharacterized protein n=1 Tax=Triticum urartu TaxID=4572 RepID=A0A8R7NXW9_TRIUA
MGKNSKVHCPTSSCARGVDCNSTRNRLHGPWLHDLWCGRPRRPKQTMAWNGALPVIC